MPSSPKMDRPHWDQLWRLHFSKARKAYPTMDLAELQERVRDAMTQSFGPRPPKAEGPKKPPLKIRLALWALKRKVESMENGFLKKLAMAAVYAVGAAWPTYQLAAPGGITSEEIGLIVGAFVAAFWGTFKSNTTIIKASRPGESMSKFGTGDGK